MQFCGSTLMKKKTQALLASTLIFPGTGQLLYKRFVTAALLACPALMSLFFLSAYSIEKALPIADKILSSSPPPDMHQLQFLISNQFTGSHPWYLQVASVTLGTVWFIGIIDSYRYGKSLEKNHST